MPRPLLASSSRHIASAQARARSSGDSVALTFTLVFPWSGSDANVLPGSVRACWNKPLELTDQSASHDAKPPWCQRSLRASNRWKTPLNRKSHDTCSPETGWPACCGGGALRAPAGQGRRSGFARTRGRAAAAVAGGERTADRGQGGGGQSVRRESRHRPDALRGVPAHARPRLCGDRDRRAGRLDRARGVRLLGRPRDPPRRHPCHASRGGSRGRGREARNISWEEAAGIGVPFVTAMEGLRRAGMPKAGRDRAGDGRQRQGRPGRGADRKLARRPRDRRGAQG